MYGSSVRVLLVVLLVSSPLGLLLFFVFVVSCLVLA